MKVSLSQSKLSSLRTDLLVVAVSGKDLSAKAKTRSTAGSVNFSQLEKHFDIPIKASLKAEDFKASPGSSHMIRPTGDKKIPRLMLVGVPADKNSEFDSIEFYRSLGAKITLSSSSAKLKKITISGNHLKLDKSENYEAFLEGLKLAQYKYTKYKSAKEKKHKGIESITILQSKKLPSGSLTKARALCAGTELARDLVNMPAADCDPKYLVSVCRSMARRKGLKVQVFDRARLKKMKAFSLLSVAEGSDKPPYLIKLSYKPKRKRAKVISIVGKGITFDNWWKLYETT